MNVIDWKPETNSLLLTLERHGFKISHVDNGEYQTKFDEVDRNDFIEECCGCDECRLYVISPVDFKQKSLYLVYGNDPGELVCDYSSHEALDVVTEEHYDRWDGKPRQFIEV